MNDYSKGELLAKLCLEKKDYKVIDRTQQPDYWHKDIDFTAFKNGEYFDIEVKWDSRMYRTQAMFFELLTNIQENQQGWANYTQADFIFYGDAKREVFYIFTANDMRSYLKAHKGEYETRIANDYSQDGRIRKQSLGAIVPIGSFRKFYAVEELKIRERLKCP